MKAVAFDLDGCLIDSLGAIVPSMRLAIGTHALPVPDDGELATLIGPPLTLGVMELLDVSLVTARSIVQAYRADYREHMLERTTLMPGVETAVRAIGAVRPLCVVTSKPSLLAIPILEHLGLCDAFASVEGPSLATETETKDITLRRAMGRVGAEIEVIVGDRHHDIDAGRACGIRTVGVLWGMGDAAELKGADHVVATPDELTALLT